MIPAGTEIRCPRKNHKVGVLTQDIVPGTVMSVKSVMFEPGQARIAGEPMRCTICGSSYIGGMNGRTQLFTNLGWLPDEPSLEPVKHNTGT